MSVLTASVLVLLSMTAFQAPAPKPDDPALPQVEIGVRVAGASGGATKWAGVGESGTDNYAWIESSCAPGAGAQAPASGPVGGWRFSSSVIQRADGLVWVNVSWQREWIGSSRPSTGTARRLPSQLVMRVGDRIEIDRLPPSDAGPCALFGARLEATLTLSRSAQAAQPAAGLSPVAKGARGSPSGATVSVPVVGQGAPGGAAAVRKDPGTGGRGVPAGAMAGAVAMRPIATFNAELWLVHTRPDGTEESQRQPLRFTSLGSAFTFPTVTISTPRGPVSVAVSGTLRAISAAGAPSELTLSLNRQVLGADDPASNRATGDGLKVMPWPKPADVLEFELPSVMVSAGNEIVGHRFSVRVRVGTVSSLPLEFRP